MMSDIGWLLLLAVLEAISVAHVYILRRQRDAWKADSFVIRLLSSTAWTRPRRRRSACTRTNAVAAIMASWGVVLGVAASHALSIAVVSPKEWQRSVLGVESGSVDYAIVEQQLAAYLVGGPRQQLLAIPRGRRNHPLDAVGVGVYAALAPPGALSTVGGAVAA